MSLPAGLAALKLTFASNWNQFDDQATGNPLWTTTLPHGLRTIAGTGELEYDSDSSVGTNPFSVDANGNLDITATPGSPVAGLPYTSGVITTQKSFAQLYGYFEMTATLPAGTGMWPAFWLLPANLSGTDELDVMEEMGSNPSQYTGTLHSPDNGIAGATFPTVDLTAGSHSYGMYWTPTTISFYLDGKLLGTAPTPADMDTPMFMIADLAIAKTVSPTTTFPATLAISDIQAYAYDPSVPGPVAPLDVTVPATLAAVSDRITAVTGVAINDPTASASDVFSVTLSDKSLGTLTVTATGAAKVTINDTWTVQLSGSLTDVNATLQTLTYENVPTGATAATSDTLTVAATDTSGNVDSERVAISLSSVATPPQFVALGATPQRVVANGHDVFVLSAGAIADPAQNAGQTDAIVNFHAAASAGGSTDFIALHGFAATSQLVFDHYANSGGKPNLAMQYYRVEGPAGNSPIFFVQMAAPSTAHLGAGNFGFYPT